MFIISYYESWKLEEYQTNQNRFYHYQPKIICQQCEKNEKKIPSS